jgi:hypothetical protein
VSDLFDLLGGLIAHLHVPRSMGSVMVPPEYDKVREAIGDFGWSSPEEVAERLRAKVHCAGCDGHDVDGSDKVNDPINCCGECDTTPPSRCGCAEGLCGMDNCPYAPHNEHEPRTEAGRALANDKEQHQRDCGYREWTPPMPCSCGLLARIRKIEEQAAAAAAMRHHDALRAIDKADEDDRRDIIDTFLASPEAAQELAEALRKTESVNLAAPMMAQRILAAWREGRAK